MRRRDAWFGALGLLASCDSVFGFGPSVDAPPPADAPPPDAPDHCEHGAPFTAIASVLGRADLTNKEVGLWLDRDELTGIVTLGGPSATSSLATTRRASMIDAFDPPIPMANLNVLSNAVGGASVTADGLTIYFHTHGANFDIMRATRSTLTDPFANPVPVAELNGSGDDLDPRLTVDGTQIYWTSADGDYGLVTARANGAQFGATTIAYGRMNRYERSPLPSADDRALYFASSNQALGFYEVRVVTRATSGDAFGAEELVQLPRTFNSAFPVGLSSDNCRLYIAAESDVFMATRER